SATSGRPHGSARTIRPIIIARSAPGAPRSGALPAPPPLLRSAPHARARRGRQPPLLRRPLGGEPPRRSRAFQHLAGRLAPGRDGGVAPRGGAGAAAPAPAPGHVLRRRERGGRVAA